MKYKSNLLQEIALKEEKILESLKTQALNTSIDTSVPGRSHRAGTTHPLAQTSEVIFEVLKKLGFCKAQGPEIEHDFYNFAALNMPKNHPARDMQDTFYISDDILLRTHTSSVQISSHAVSKRTPLKNYELGSGL